MRSRWTSIPFTFTGTCEGELCRIRDDYSDFERAGVQVLAVSCDSRHAQRIWAEQQGFTFPVLSDFWPHGAVAKDYGVFNDQLGCAIRATFLIDKKGNIVDEFQTESLGTARDPQRYADSLAKLSSKATTTASGVARHATPNGHRRRKTVTTLP